MKSAKIHLATIFVLCSFSVSTAQETCCNALNTTFTLVYCLANVPGICVDEVAPCDEATFEMTFAGVDIFSGTEQCSFPGPTCDTPGFCSGGFFDLTPLPVGLSSFDAFASNSGIELAWITSTELNNLGFEVEHSIDRTSWETIEFVNGMGTTTERQDYSYLDTSPIIGGNYYRLKQIDFDGRFTYGPATLMNWDGFSDRFELSVSPNPAINSLRPIFPAGIGGIRHSISYEVFDARGRLVLIETNRQSTDQIGIDRLAPGPYILRASVEERTYSAQFIKLAR